MRGCLGFFLYIILTLWLLFAGLLMMSVASWLFNREFYVDVFNNDAFYTALQQNGVPALLANLEVNGRQVLDEANPAFPALVDATNELVTTEFLQTTTTTFVNQLFAFFDNPSQGLMISIDLTAFKTQLAGDAGNSFSAAYVQSLSPCSPGQQNFDAEYLLPVCIPAGTSQEQAISQVLEYKNQFVDEIPDRLEVVEDTAEDWRGLPDTSLASLFNSAAVGVLAGALILWLINAIIGGAGLRGFLLWLAFMLFLPAIIVALTGAAVNAELASSAVRDIFDNVAASDLSPEVQRSLGDLAVSALGRVGNGFLTVGGTALAVAAVLFLLGLITRRRQGYPGDFVNIPPNPQGPIFTSR